MAAKNGKGRTGPDWNRLKAEYLKGGISYRELASKFGVPESTLTRHAIAGRWKQERERIDSAVAAELPGVVVASKLDEIGRCKAAQLADAEWLRALVRSDDRASLADRAKAIQAAQAVERKALNQADPSAAHSPDDHAKQGNGGGMTIVPANSVDWKDEATYGRA